MNSDNVLFGFTFIQHSTPKRPHADIKRDYTVTIKDLPYCDNRECMSLIARLVTGITDKDSYNIAEDRIDEIKQLKEKTWLIKTTIPYKD